MRWKKKSKITKCCEIYYIKTAETYRVSCKKNTVNENPNIRKIKQNRLMLLSNSAVYGKKKWRFIKNQELH